MWSKRTETGADWKDRSSASAFLPFFTHLATVFAATWSEQALART